MLKLQAKVWDAIKEGGCQYKKKAWHSKLGRYYICHVFSLCCSYSKYIAIYITLCQIIEPCS